MDRLTFVKHSVGIIGGSDGPTAIFIAGKFSPAPLIAAAVLFVAAAMALIWIFKKK